MDLLLTIMMFGNSIDRLLTSLGHWFSTIKKKYFFIVLFISLTPF